MKCVQAAILIATVSLSIPSAAAGLPSSAIRRVAVSVAATNDEWTTTTLTINSDDLIIVGSKGRIRVGQYENEVDANGTRSGSGVLEFKVGVSAGRPTGTFALYEARLRGEMKFRVRDSRYDDNSGAFDVDVALPQAAFPPATRIWDVTRAEGEDAHAIITGAMTRHAQAIVTAH